MKTMRKTWLLPIVVFAIAIASAFASNVEEINPPPVLGFIDAPHPCQISTQCSLIGEVACKIGAKTAYRMNSSNTACDIVAWKLQ